MYLRLINLHYYFYFILFTFFSSNTIKASSITFETPISSELKYKNSHEKVYEDFNPQEIIFEEDLQSIRNTLSKHFKTFKDAKLGDPTALACVANYYLRGVILVKNERIGIQMLTWLHNKQWPEAGNILYRYYVDNHNFTEAKKWEEISHQYEELLNQY